jgi:hypothetical protein
MKQVPYMDFAPKHIKFFDEYGGEIHYTQVNKVDIVRQADYLAEQFFTMRWKQRLWFAVGLIFIVLFLIERFF